MIEINGKEYRNLQEQVLKNQEDITDIKEDTYTKTEVDNALSLKANVSDVYDKPTADATFQTIAGMSAYALKDYTHQITIYADGSTLHCYLTFNIRNNVSTPYTTVNSVYDALIAKYGENEIIGGNGYYQTQNGYKELLFNPSTRGSNDYALDADYFEVDANFDSGNQSINLTNFNVKDVIL